MTVPSTLTDMCTSDGGHEVEITLELSDEFKELVRTLRTNRDKFIEMLGAWGDSTVHTSIGTDFACWRDVDDCVSNWAFERLHVLEDFIFFTIDADGVEVVGPFYDYDQVLEEGEHAKETEEELQKLVEETVNG